ncbi:MAG: hypothetical protein QM750_19905 [Rubrivivax sp.]
MPKLDPELLQSALDGFNGVEHDAARHGMLTSSLHGAYCVGHWLRETGRPAPREIRQSRGDTMVCNDMLVRLNWRHVRHPLITRER